MLLNNRYVITGVGSNDLCGLNISESFNNTLKSNKSVSAEDYDSFLTDAGFTNKDRNRLTHLSKKILSVFEQARIDSQINFSEIKNVPVIFSVSTRNISPDYQSYLLSLGTKRTNPYVDLNFSPDFISNYIQARYGLMGPSCTLSAACSTGLYSLDYAIRLMEMEKYECAVVGTASSGLNDLDLAWFKNLGAISKSGISKPFDRDRDGFVMANGYATLIIETLEHARNRNAKIYAEIVGLGLANDGNNLTSPDEEMRGSKMALEKCLRHFNGDIDYINAHATSTPVGDDIEAKLMATYFPGATINSNKGHLGHSIHSANLVEIIHTLMAMKHSLIPPTANLQNPLEANLDFVMHNPREKKIRYALKNSFGFGGRNGFILLKNAML